MHKIILCTVYLLPKSSKKPLWLTCVGLVVVIICDELTCVGFAVAIICDEFTFVGFAVAVICFELTCVGFAVAVICFELICVSFAVAVICYELTCVGFAVAVICNEPVEGEARQVKVFRHLNRSFVLPKENQIFGSPAICAIFI